LKFDPVQSYFNFQHKKWLAAKSTQMVPAVAQPGTANALALARLDAPAKPTALHARPRAPRKSVHAPRKLRVATQTARGAAADDAEDADDARRSPVPRAFPH